MIMAIIAIGATYVYSTTKNFENFEVESHYIREINHFSNVVNEYENILLPESDSISSYVSLSTNKVLNNMYKEIFDINTESSMIINLTKKYISLLQEYLGDIQSLEDIYQNTLCGIFTNSTISDSGYVFNLIRFDTNPIGHGTLERTWAFLQIIDNNENTFVHGLYEKSAEVPVFIHHLQLEYNSCATRSCMKSASIA